MGGGTANNDESTDHRELFSNIAGFAAGHMARPGSHHGYPPQGHGSPGMGMGAMLAGGAAAATAGYGVHHLVHGSDHGGRDIVTAAMGALVMESSNMGNMENLSSENLASLASSRNGSRSSFIGW